MQLYLTRHNVVVDIRNALLNTGDVNATVVTDIGWRDWAVFGFATLYSFLDIIGFNAEYVSNFIAGC